MPCCRTRAFMEIGKLFDVTDKVVVVTGGGTGIGRMIATGFAANKAKVYIASRKEAARVAEQIAKETGGFCKGFSADLSKEEEQKALVEAVRQDAGGRVHVLVNNSGSNWAEPIESYPLSGFDKVMDINLKAVFSLTRLFLPLLESGASAVSPSRVINIGSIDGLRVCHVDSFAYSASKAALHRLTQVLAGKLGDRHITVNALAPGPFQSKMMKVTIERAHDEIVDATVLGRLGRGEDMAGACVWLASTAGAYVTGAVIPIDGGILVKPRL